MKALRGFSLIELIIGMVIFGVLVAIAMPAFSNWLRNARVRTAAESVQNGLQLARAEAVRRNTAVGFRLVTTADNSCALSAAGPAWVVSVGDPITAEGRCNAPESEAVRIIQSRSGAESAGTTIDSTQNTFVFNSLGRLTTAAAAIDVTSPTGACMAAQTPGPVRCLRVAVAVGGQIRMCDPALPSGDAQGSCP